YRAQYVEISVEVALQLLGKTVGSLLEFHSYTALFPSIRLEKERDHHGECESHRHRDGKFATPVCGTNSPDQHQRRKDQGPDGVTYIPGDPVGQEISRMNNTCCPKRSHPNGRSDETAQRRYEGESDHLLLGRQCCWHTDETPNQE